MEPLLSYFNNEKNESLIFMIIGIAAALFAVFVFVALREKFFIGIAVPLLLVGIIQIVVGGTVYFRTNNQISGLQKEFAQDTEAAVQTETARMDVVMKNFTLYKYIEVAFILSGVLFILFLRNRELMLGLGIGLLLQGTLMLTADIFAERRGEKYILFLNTYFHHGKNVSQ